MQTNLLSRKSPSSAPAASPSRKRARGPVLKVVAGLIGVLLLVLGIKALQFKKMMSGPQGPPPETVASAEVEKRNWRPVLSAIGSVSPVWGVMVSSEVTGIVSEVAFESGAFVKKGDLLVRLVAGEQTAQLRSAEADAELTRSNLERSRDLAARKVISQAELDSAEAQHKQRLAVVENLKSVIDRRNIRAPFDGKTGIRQVNVGQTVEVNKPLVALQSVDPVYVDFTIPQQRISELTPGLEVSVRTDSFPEREFKGKLTAINSMIDSATRNVTLQATLENPGELLKPGMFAKVEVLLPEEKPVLVIPATAVSYAPFGDSVYVIEKKTDEKTKEESTVVRQQFIRIGEARGDFVSVTKGLQGGEQVVSAGAFKLRNGMAVQVKNDVTAPPEEKPKPADT
jgi:membrane fusion protein (multidrug efflux system)